MTTATPTVRILRRNEVLAIVGVHRVTLHHMVKRGDFPAPVKIGKTALAWRSTDVEAWYDQLKSNVA